MDDLSHTTTGRGSEIQIRNTRATPGKDHRGRVTAAERGSVRGGEAVDAQVQALEGPLQRRRKPHRVPGAQAVTAKVQAPAVHAK